MAATRERSRATLVAFALCLLAACASSSHPSAHRATTPTTRVKAQKRFVLYGTYTQPAVRLEDVKTVSSIASSYRVDTGTIVHGDLEGRTTGVTHGVVNTKTLANEGTVTETFTGRVAGIGSGHLNLDELFRVTSRGDLTLTARIVGGDGALAGVSGTMHLTGFSDLLTGKRAGTYTAHFTRT
jgi:hypothetical protein